MRLSSRSQCDGAAALASPAVHGAVAVDSIALAGLLLILSLAAIRAKRHPALRKAGNSLPFLFASCLLFL